MTAAAVGTLLTLSASATATAAEDAATGAEGATSEWSVGHGTASASGLIRLVDGKSAIEGEIRNTGSECYSLVIQPMIGVWPGPLTKLATNRGSGSAPVYREYTGTPLVKVCQGTGTTFSDCGPAQRLPAGATAPQGYVFDASWLASAESKAYCESQGKKGVSEGRWSAYLCREEYRGGADIPLLQQVLYVKK
jgi:hypothetical protein